MGLNTSQYNQHIINALSYIEESSISRPEVKQDLYYIVESLAEQNVAKQLLTYTDEDVEFISTVNSMVNTIVRLAQNG